MKVLNVVELDHLIESVSFLKGAEFQSVLGLKDIITLKLWSDGPFWLTFNLSANKPFFLAFKGEHSLNPGLLKKALKKPLNIFLTTHFKGLSVTKIERVKGYGRLIRFYFDNDEELYLEFRAYPGGLNFSAMKGEKSVHWNKPSPLEKADEAYSPETVRSPSVVLEEGVEFLNLKVKAAQKEPMEVKSLIARKKIEEGLLFLKSDGYKRFSDALSNEEELSPDLLAIYKDGLSVRENIEWGYGQQKLKDVKVERLEKRLAELIQKTNTKKNKEVVSSGLKATRALEIKPGVRALCGKSAKENMELLRKAKSWHIWMHLKDYPSGHLILDIPRNYAVSEKELESCGLFLFKVAAPRKLHASDQVKFEVIFTEAKFVKPIKGAKSGLVQPSRTKARLYEWRKEDKVTY